MISVCILTKNSEKTIRKTLDSIQPFSDILILDTGSSDLTLSIAREYSNVTIFEAPFTGFGALRNKVAKHAKNDWIFALDSDEVVTKELFEEMTSLKLDPKISYTFPRKNFFNGKWIRGCGWYPDRVTRLYNRKETMFRLQKVHESIENRVRRPLKTPLLHTPYQSTEMFLKKMQHYSTLFAQEHRGKKKSSFRTALVHSIFAFLKSYVLKRGIFDGAEGFIISLYNANTTFYKYLKLAEKNSLVDSDL